MSENDGDLIEADASVAGRGWPRRCLRAIRWLAVAVVVLIFIAWMGWTEGVPRYRPGLRPGESYGLDVSHHQGTIDWRKVASDDIEFVYVKATEGGDHVDSRYAANARDATTAGLDIGAYHFFTFCRPGKDQAANFLKVAPPVDGWLPPAVDVEYAGNCSKRPPEADVVRELTDFIDVVSAAWGQQVVAYVLHDVFDRYPALADLGQPQWRRHLFTRPNSSDWLIWQVSGFAKVNGVDGGVDLNVGQLER